MTDLTEASAKAAVLAEALPWLERLHGATVVVKYGGNAMTDDALKAGFAQDIVFLRLAGLRPVVVHGGGPQISSMLGRLGVPSEFKGGLRVTTPEVMDVVGMVLVGQVQRELVGLINEHGTFAVGMSGRGRAPVPRRAPHGDRRRRAGRHRPGGRRDRRAPGLRLAAARRRPDPGDLDRGPRRRRGLAQRERRHGSSGPGRRPGRGEARGADRRRGSVSPTGRDVDSVIRTIGVERLRALLPSLESGMVPKMEACLRAVDGGVPRAHVIDGRVLHCVLLEVFTDSGIGTMVLPEEVAA